MTDPIGLWPRGLTNYGDPRFRALSAPLLRALDGLFDRHAGDARSSASPTRRRGFNNCHRHFPELIEAVKRGVLAAGGLPLVFPDRSRWARCSSIPTSLMFRNLMAMDTEEMIRAQPMDAVVLIGGCDKTVPAQLMGAVSADRAGDPARRRADDDRRWHGRAARRLHRLPPLLGALPRRRDRRTTRSRTVEGRLATTAGTCAVMGTASTHGLASPRRSA